MAQTTEAVNFNKEENEFVLVVKKRLRNYKKKMTNIAAIEAKVANKEKIVKEQEDALKTKDTNAKIIQELENVESQLLEVKQSESQKQFSLEDVKTLIALMQTQGQVKKVEGVTDQQLKHVQSSANSLLRPSSKWSADDTVKHAHKLVRDQVIKSALAKISAEEAKQEAEKPVVPAPTPVAPVEPAPAPVVAEAPKETAPVTPAPVVAETPKETAPAPATTESKESSEESGDGKEKGFRRGGGNYRGRKPRGSGENRGNGNGEHRPRNFNNKPRGGNKPQQHTN